MKRASPEIPPCIMHVDMDAFFAAVEQLDDPSLRGKPVIIGLSARGVVATASYEARQFGVRSAMPVVTARRLCPKGIFLKGRKERYQEMSALVMHCLGQFSPLVEQASIDEAYLDASGLERIFGTVEELGERVKEAVYASTGGLTCSIGVAPVKFVAKIASDMRKPNGLFIVTPEEMLPFIHALPVQRIPGVGRQTLQILERLSVVRVGDVLTYPEDFWRERLGKVGEMLFARACGIDPRLVTPYNAPKSESAENTLAEDTCDKDVLRRYLLAQAERVGASLRRHGLSGRTITLKVKYSDFQQITRSRTLARRTNATETLFDVACDLLSALSLSRGVRLVGLGVSGFEQTPEQLMLTDTLPCQNAATHEQEERRLRLDTALDTLRERFGRDSVMRGRLFTEGKSKD